MRGAGQHVFFPPLKVKRHLFSKTALQPPTLIPENESLSCLADSIPVYPVRYVSDSIDPERGEAPFVRACAMEENAERGADCLFTRIVALLCAPTRFCLTAAGRASEAEFGFPT